MKEPLGLRGTKAFGDAVKSCLGPYMIQCAIIMKRISGVNWKVKNLDHSGIGIIVNHAVVKLLGNILINLLIRVVFPGHPEIY